MKSSTLRLLVTALFFASLIPIHVASSAPERSSPDYCEEALALRAFDFFMRPRVLTASVWRLAAAGLLLAGLGIAQDIPQDIPKDEQRRRTLVALAEFESPDLMVQLQKEGTELSKELKNVRKKHSQNLAADIDKKMPKNAAEWLLASALYSLYQQGVPLNLPPRIRQIFESMDSITAETKRQMEKLDKLISPLSLDVHFVSPLEADELIPLTKLYIEFRLARNAAMREYMPILIEAESPLRRIWQEDRFTWSVWLGIHGHAPGPIHLAVLVDNAPITWLALRTEHRVLRHYILQNGVLKEAHPPRQKDVKFVGGGILEGSGSPAPHDAFSDPDLPLKVPDQTKPALPPQKELDPDPLKGAA